MRQVRIIREKRFLACTAPFYMIVDGNLIRNNPIENGHISTHGLDEGEHTFQVAARFDEGTAYSNICTVPRGIRNYQLTIRIKMGLTIGKVFLDCSPY